MAILLCHVCKAPVYNAPVYNATIYNATIYNATVYNAPCIVYNVYNASKCSPTTDRKLNLILWM